MEDQKDLPKPQIDLPLPHKDLPIPEKELPQPHDMQLEKPHELLLSAHAQSVHHWPLSKHLMIILILLAIVALGFYLYVYSSLNKQLETITNIEQPSHE